jgi:hypothetical protein
MNQGVMTTVWFCIFLEKAFVIWSIGTAVINVGLI